MKGQSVKDAVRDAATLTDAACDVMYRLYPSWTVDELLCHPTEARKLVGAVRKELNRKIDEVQVCKALLERTQSRRSAFGIC